MRYSSQQVSDQLRRLLLGVVFLCGATNVGGQLSAGPHRIRYRSDSASDWRNGVLLSQHGDTLVARSCADCPDLHGLVGRGDFARVDVYRGGYGTRESNAIRGALIGAGAASVYLYTAYHRCERTRTSDVGLPCGFLVFRLPAVGLAGALAGAAVGLAIPPSRWISLGN